VSSGNANQLTARDSFAECFGATNYRNSKVTRALKLRMVLGDGGGINDFARAGYVRCIVSVKNVNTESLEIC
jgi:hypothetical protein